MTTEDFWNWFNDNKTAIEDLILEEAPDYHIYEKLTEILQQYSKFLIPELTQDENNKFVLVISCDGEKEGIPFVEELVARATKVDNWKVLKYRQPGPMEFIPYDGLNLKRSQIYLTWDEASSQQYYIKFFIKGYSSRDSRYRVAAILHLDHTIGEYSSMTRIEGFEFNKLGWLDSKKDLKTLDDLKAEIDNNFA